MATTSVRIPDELLEKLNQTAIRRKRSKSWLINDALAEYLEREEQRVRMLNETETALHELKAGKVVDGDEVLQWLDSWGE